MPDFLEVVYRVSLAFLLLIQIFNKNCHGSIDVTQDDTSENLCEDGKHPISAITYISSLVKAGMSP